MSADVDVVALGEILVELRTDQPLRETDQLQLSFSGDVLNAAAAASAAGARTAILGVVGDDELGDAIVARAAELGVDARWIARAPRPNGLYMVSADIAGDREFLYWRAGSAGSTLSEEHVDAARDLLTSTRALLLSGIAMAISPTSRAAALAAMRLVSQSGGRVTYDPNVRPKLTTAADAQAVLAEAAPLADVLTPSCPGDSRPLFGTDDAAAAVDRALALGAGAVLVTSGTSDVVVGRSGERTTLPVPVNPHPVDATGAGDVFAGTVTARVAAGDELLDAARLGVAAASLSVSGLGGTGRVPTLAETRQLAGE